MVLNCVRLFLSISCPLYYDKVQTLGPPMNSNLNWADTVIETCNIVFTSVHTLKKI